MASKRRKRRRSCEGKERFTTEQEARDALRTLCRVRRVGATWVVYGPCQWCKGYHYGRPTAKQRANSGNLSIQMKELSRKRGGARYDE